MLVGEGSAAETGLDPIEPKSCSLNGPGIAGFENSVWGNRVPGGTLLSAGGGREKGGGRDAPSDDPCGQKRRAIFHQNVIRKRI